MKLFIACLVVLSLLCLPVAASACDPAVQATFGAGYGDPCAAPVSSLGVGGYGAMAGPVAFAPAARYRMVRPVVAAAPLYGGYSSGAAFVAPARQFVAVPVPARPGLIGRLHAARQAFRRGF